MRIEADMIAHSYNLSAWKAEGGRKHWVQSQPGLQNKPLSQNKLKKKEQNKANNQGNPEQMTEEGGS